MTISFEHPAIRRAISVGRLVFTPLAVIFLAVATLHARDLIDSVLQSARPDLLLAAVGCWCGTHLLAPIFALIVLRQGDTVLPYRTVLGIHVRRLPARYLPGGIWHTVSRMSDFSQRGAGRQLLFALIVGENLLPLAAAILLAALAGWWAGLAAWALAALACALALSAGIFHGLRYVLRGTRAIALRPFVGMLLATLGFWLLAGTSFALYWLAFPSATNADITHVYGAYWLAWSGGFLAFFAPQGIGVFESIFAFLLHGAAPFSQLVVIAAGFRVVVLVADVTSYTVLAIFEGFRRWIRSPSRTGSP